MPQVLSGTEVEARGLRWIVLDAEESGPLETRYRLRCLDGGMRGEEVELLAPFEPIRSVSKEFQPRHAASLQHWRLFHQAFLLEQELGPDALLAAQAGRLKIAPYQLVPVMRALQMSRPRLMLADSVGLGKTIQAGIILTELIARRRAHRILIVSPAGPLLQQWSLEMRDRFGLRFTTLAGDSLQTIRSQNELGTNPFDFEALGLISIDFAKQEKVLQDLERTQFDVVVVDEAHHCVRLGGQTEHEDSQRRHLAELLARRSDCLLLLTATPHDGFDAHFASIIELLDPSLVDGRGLLRAQFYKRHIVRRLKSHVRDLQTGEPLFKEREVHPKKVTFSKAKQPRFTSLQQCLLELILPLLRRALRQRRYGDVLAFVSLLKRSVSSVAACRKTLEVIQNRLESMAERGAEEQEARKQRLRMLRDYRRRADRYGALSFEEEQERQTLEAEDIAAELSEGEADALFEEIATTERETRRERDRLRRVKEVRDAMNSLLELAKAAEDEDPKLLAILEEITKIRAAEPKANVLIYTEYTDSQDALFSSLQAAAQKSRLSGSILMLSGRDDEKTRIEITQKFREQDNLILVSTDATAEGLNLHARCHHLIHLELPYNPNRLEQRNGRIDRFGQTYNPQVRYLYLARTFEDNLLIRLISKYERQRRLLGFVPNTLGIASSDERGIEGRLLQGLVEDDPQLFEKQEAEFNFASGEDEDTTTPAYREMLAEIERAFSGYQSAMKSQVWLGDAGVNAEQKLVDQAEAAQAQAVRHGVHDLLGFVKQAVQADSATKAFTEKDGVIELKLPPEWTFRMEDITGFDAAEKTMRLTSDMNVTHDSQDRPVGFLGRAHPLVRRALDRVRNVRFGSDDQPLDRRVSAARSTSSSPEILYTYLGAIHSAAGREYERVFAVKLGASGAPQAFTEFADWEELADLSRAISPKGIWENHFANWEQNRRTEALDAAFAELKKASAPFLTEHADLIQAEHEKLSIWLQQRTEEICGPRSDVVQLDIFVSPESGSAAPTQAISDAERLAQFATDASHPTKARHEAEGVLKLFESRSADLSRRAEIGEPELSPLGMLMLVPETLVGSGGA